MMKGSSLIVALLVTSTAAFQVVQFHRTHTSTSPTSRTCLHALSRREVLSSIPAALATAAVAAAPQRSIAAGAVSYQGVYTDPTHPKGYRVLTGDAAEATMQLQDDPGGTVYTIPIRVKSDGSTELLIDFSVKGGPADVPGVLGSDAKGVATLTFPDGNVWKKETGVIGVYRDGLNPEYVRVIRKDKGSVLTVDLINGDKTVTVPAKAGSSKVTFDFPGKPNDPGTLDSKKNTISFGDGNVWTKL